MSILYVTLVKIARDMPSNAAALLVRYWCANGALMVRYWRAAAVPPRFPPLRKNQTPPSSPPLDFQGFADLRPVFCDFGKAGGNNRRNSVADLPASRCASSCAVGALLPRYWRAAGISA